LGQRSLLRARFSSSRTLRWIDDTIGVVDVDVDVAAMQIVERVGGSFVYSPSTSSTHPFLGDFVDD
jgi:hypothetical protein